MKTTKTDTYSEEKNSPILYIIKGTAIAYAITITVFIVYALLLTYTDITENNLRTVVMITITVSVLISGFDTARAVQKKGLIFGLISGLVYSVIMILIGLSVVPDYNITFDTLINLILGLAGGGFGGIIGINLKKH